MRFMTLYKPGRETTAPPTHREMADMGQFIEELTRAGVLLATGGLPEAQQEAAG